MQGRWSIPSCCRRHGRTAGCITRQNDAGGGAGGHRPSRTGRGDHRPAAHRGPLLLRGHPGADGPAGRAGHPLRRDAGGLLLLRRGRRPGGRVHPPRRVPERHHHPHGRAHPGARGGEALQNGLPRLHHGALPLHRPAGGGGAGADGGGLCPRHPGRHRLQGAPGRRRRFCRCTVSTLAQTARENHITKTALITVGGFLGDRYDRSKLYDPAFTHGFREASK